jgi:hypothetical protein
MPKELTHIVIAEHVLATLKKSGEASLANILDAHRPAFYLGAIVPDAFFYRVIPLPSMSGGLPTVSSQLHTKDGAKNDERGEGLFQAIAASPAMQPLKTAFAAGIMTHTISDRMIHGVIDYYIRIWRHTGTVALATHRQFETLMDVAVLARSRVRPVDFPLQKILSLTAGQRECLFRFCALHFLKDSAAFHHAPARHLRWAHLQQLFFLKLFRTKGLYRCTGLINRLAGGRLAFLSYLFYPAMVRTGTFPIGNMLDLNALTDGADFQGDVASLVSHAATRSVRLIQACFRRLPHLLQ